MNFNRMPPDALNHVVLGAGVIFSGDFPSIYELQDSADDNSILGATSGGVSLDLTPKITTFSGDGNKRRDASYVRYDAWTAKLSCKLVTLSPALFEYALSGAEGAAAVSQLEVIPQWCGVDYCYGGWKLVDAEDKSGKASGAEETEALLAETDSDACEGKVLVETERNPITWKNIPWRILRDLRLSVTRGDDAIANRSEDWKLAVPGNATFGIDIHSPEDGIIQDAHTEISIGVGRYQFKPHTYTRLSLQAETGSILMNRNATRTFTANILPKWGYELEYDETEIEQLEEEEGSSNAPKEQYVWQILTYTGDPVDVEEIEGSKPPEKEEAEEGGEGEGDEEKEEEQIEFTCGQTVTVKALNPGTVVLRCTATRLDARESSDLIITVLPVSAFYVKKDNSGTAGAASDDGSTAWIPFMVKAKTGKSESMVFAEEAAEDEDGGKQILTFTEDSSGDGDGGDDEYVNFIVGNTSNAQDEIEETTKALASRYAGRMARARQQLAEMGTQVEADDDDETDKEYDETIETLEEIENASGWGNASAVGGGGVSTVASDIWWVGNYGFESDGGQYIAVHLKNAMLTSGIRISSDDAKLAKVDVSFEAAYDNALEDAIPLEVYISGEDEKESSETEEGAEE